MARAFSATTSVSPSAFGNEHYQSRSRVVCTCASGSAPDQVTQGANDADHRRGLVDDGTGGPGQGGQIAVRVLGERRHGEEMTSMMKVRHCGGVAGGRPLEWFQGVGKRFRIGGGCTPMSRGGTSGWCASSRATGSSGFPQLYLSGRGPRVTGGPRA